MPRAAWLFLLSALLMAVECPRLLVQAWELARLPHPTCMTEVYILDGVRDLASGQPLYPPLAGLPWVYHIYHPLTYLPAGLAGRAAGLDLDGLLVAGRMLPYFAALGIAALIGWFVVRATGSRLAAALGIGLLFHAHSSTLTDFFRCRPETPALFCVLLGWVLAQLRPRGWPLFAGLACAVAIGFKQTYLAAPAAIVLQLLIERQFRPLATFLAVSGVGVAAIVAASWLWLGGGYFQHAIFAMQADPVRPWQASKFFYPLLIREHWQGLLAPVAVAVGWLAFVAARGESDSRRVARGLLLYLTSAFGWTSIAHGKEGADLNYHGELSTLMMLSVAAAAGDLLSRSANQPRRERDPNASDAFDASSASAASIPALGLAATLLAALLIPLVRHGPGWNQVCSNRAHPPPHGFSTVPPFGDAAPWVARYQGDADRALVFDNEIAVRLGRPVVLDWLTLALLLDAKRLDLEQLAAPIRARKFDPIVFDQRAWDTWTTSLRATALASGYTITLENDRLCELRRVGQGRP